MSEDRDSDLLKTMAAMATRAEKGQAPQGNAGGVAARGRLLEPARLAERLIGV